MIRSFLYLDSQKLRSLSSQFFEGVTDYVLQSEHESKEAFEQQKGPFTSGRILGDIFSKDKSSSEMRFLEDHAYSIFEDRVVELSMVEDSSVEGFSPASAKTFFKITNNLRINDLAATTRLFEKFNDIGEAIARMTLASSYANPQAAKNISDNDVKKIAVSADMHMSPKFLHAAKILIDFGLNDLIEGSMVVDKNIFSAPLKREFLRESADMILNKYSRVTQQKFSMIGIFTQRGSVAVDDETIPNVKDAGGIKAAMRTLALHMQTVEQTFSGPRGDEIVLDPVAVYSTI